MLYLNQRVKEMLKKSVVVAGFLAMIVGLWAGVAVAQSEAGKEYVVQADDWLSKIAEKEYGDMLAYPAIVEATNAKAAEDSSFAMITNPDVIEIGQKLWIPLAAGGEAVVAAPTTVTATEVINYTPAEIPAERQAGSCWTNAIGLGRADAYRCMVGNAIHDPCFVVDDQPTVVCDANPATGETGFVLELTEPLPAPETGQVAMPWLVELADGQVCGLMTGTVPGVGDRIASYGCPDRTYLFNDFQQGEVWQAEQVTFEVGENGFAVTSSKMAPVRRVWR